MKVLQINSVYKNGSTGRTMYEVEDALINSGHEAYIAYGYGADDSDERHYRINSKLSNNIHKIMSRVTGLEGYFSFCSTIKLIRYIKNISPDIIHLRCLHGDYINLPLLFKYLKKAEVPVCMNLHDCWDFTGHCPYFGTCDKWKTSCRDCDKYKAYPKSMFFDTSNKIFKDKMRWYSGIKDLYIIAVSKWLCDLASESMFKGRDIRYIYNWISREDFNDTLGVEGKKSNDFQIVFVSASWEPGTYRYMKLNQLLTKIPQHYNVKIVGIYRGEKSKRKRTEYLGYVGNRKELAKLYRESDVYVHLSKEEAFGKVIAEANACGIPAIVFDISGCAEVVSNKSGYRVPVDDIDCIVEKLKEIEKKGSLSYKEGAIENVEVNFNYNTNVKTLIDLYEEIYKNNDTIN